MVSIVKKKITRYKTQAIFTLCSYIADKYAL
jgi:hypothetical protein